MSNAQSEAKYIVGNSYGSSGCDGPVLSIASVSTDQCYYAAQECETNLGLAPECEYLKSMSIGTNVSLIGTCKNGTVVGTAYLGDACYPGGIATATQLTNSLLLPTDSCLLNVT
jgi:hypothetical protein